MGTTSTPNEHASAAHPGDPLAHLRWWCDASGRAATELGEVLAEVTRLRAELAEQKRLVLAHPDGGCAGCGCDMVDTAEAVGTLSRMMDALTELFNEQKALNRKLAERVAGLVEIVAKRAEGGTVQGHTGATQ